MKNLFDKQITLLQIGKEFLKILRTDNHIIEFQENIVSVYLVIALKSKMFAKNVQLMDKFLPPYLPEICWRYLGRGLKCHKRIVVVLISD